MMVSFFHGDYDRLSRTNQILGEKSDCILLMTKTDGLGKTEEDHLAD